MITVLLMDIDSLQSRLGHTFSNTALLQQALTHRSHSSLHNERLEFLGDSVLNCVIASLLFHRYTKIDEGDLSRLRANLVKQQSLYEVAQRLELSQCLRLGEGELKSGGFRRPSILAATLERNLKGIWKLSTVASVDGNVVCSANLMLAPDLEAPNRGVTTKPAAAGVQS